MIFQIVQTTLLLALIIGFSKGSPLDKILGKQEDHTTTDIPSTTTGDITTIVADYTEVTVTENSDVGSTETDSTTTSSGTTQLPSDVVDEPEPINENEVPIPNPPCNESVNPLEADYHQRAILYDAKDQQGEEFMVPPTNAVDLRKLGFDNRAKSFCLTGIWLFYVESNFNTDPYSGMEYVFGPNNFCANLRFVPDYVRSVRSVGSPADYRSDTLTIFRGTYFQGDAEYTFSDLPKLELLGQGHKSLVITGNSSWTFYSGAEYQGNAVCLHPPYSNDTAPYFVCDLRKVQIPYGSVQSVRKGCYVEANCDHPVHSKDKGRIDDTILFS